MLSLGIQRCLHVRELPELVDVGGRRVRILAAEDGEGAAGFRLRQHVEGIPSGNAPRVRWNDHPVESDCPMEAAGAGSSEGLHAAHAEPEHTDPLALGGVGRQFEITEHSVEVEGGVHAFLQR